MINDTFDRKNAYVILESTDNPMQVTVAKYFLGENKMFEGVRSKKIREDVVAAKFFREALKSAVVEYVSDQLSYDIQHSILTSLRLQKSYLFKDIMTHLAETEDFEQIKSFIKDSRAFAEVWITELIFEIKSNKMNLLTRLAKARTAKVFHELNISASLATRSTETNIVVWIKEFVDNSNKAICLFLSNSTFELVTTRYLPDLHHFLDILQTQFCEIEKDVLESFSKENAKSFKWKIDPVISILDIIWGCTEVCIFCKTPCSNADKSHIDTGTPHKCWHHRPCGIVGMKFSDNTLILTDCHFLVTSNNEYKDVKGKTGKYMDYRQHFPDWDICPSSDLDFCKYWIWIFVKFQKELEEMHNAEIPYCPIDWYSITKAEAIASLD